jgi:hypothetical protein
MVVKQIAAAGAIAAVALSVPVVGSPGAAGATTVLSTTWRAVYHTHFATNTLLEGVAALGPKHAWAVGSDYPRGFVLSWNGKTWRPMKALPHGYYPDAVAASSPENVWVFSEALSGAAASRWNGRRWLQFPMPHEEIGAGVAAVSSASDVWYSTGQILLHWNGDGWSTQITPTPVGLANGPGGQVWEALAVRLSDHRFRLVARRWNGRRWISVPVPHIPVIANVRDVLSIASSRHISILVEAPRGSSGRPVRRGVFRVDGRWKVVGIPDLGLPGGLAATGRRLTWFGPDALFNGRKWLTGSAILSVIDMAGVPGTSATWAVGAPVTNGKGHAAWIWLNGKL